MLKSIEHVRCIWPGPPPLGAMYIDDQQVGAAARADDVRVAVARGPARAVVQAAMLALCARIAGMLVAEEERVMPPTPARPW